MSSPLPSSDGRPLDQLKVAELKDELRKRGLSLKGVKKDLFERLEEAIKKEQAETPQTDTADTDMAVQDNSVDSSHHEESDVKDIQENNEEPVNLDAHEASGEVITEGNIEDETDPIEITAHSSETCILEPVLEEKQHDVTNSDVMEEPQVRDNFVEGAVMLHHTSTGDNTSQPGVVTGDQVYDTEDSSRGDGLVSQSDVLSESDGVVRGSLNPDVVNDSFVPQEPLQSCRNDSDVEMPIIEGTVDTDSHVTENVEVLSKVDIGIKQSENASNDAMTPVAVNDLAENELAPSIEDTSTVQTPLPSMAEGNDTMEVEVKMTVLNGSEPVEVPPNAEEIPPNAEEVPPNAEEVPPNAEEVPPNAEEVPPNAEEVPPNAEEVPPNAEEVPPNAEEVPPNAEEVPPNAEEVPPNAEEVPPNAEEDKGDTLYKSSDSVEPVDVKMELGDFERPTFDTEIEVVKTTTEEGSCDKDIISTSGQLEEIYEDMKVHDKPVEEDIRSYMEVEEKKEVEIKPTEGYAEIRPTHKRKDEDDFKQQEPAKRIRRWNTGNDLKLETTMPLTMDTVKEITSPETKQGSPVGVHKTIPKALTTSKPMSTTSKGEPETNGTTRAVPAPAKSPTTSLKIERFVRPFTLKAAKDMLAEFGQCVDFWMDQIKTHCYITYSSVEEAIAARNGVYNKQWPPSFGNLLVAEYVDPEEVKVRADGTLEKAKSASQVSPANSNAPAVVHKPSAPFHQLNAVPPPPPLRERPLPPQIQEPELQIPTLDDLFVKTKAKPHIYYLPLTEEQVAEKLAKLSKPAAKA